MMIGYLVDVACDVTSPPDELVSVETVNVMYPAKPLFRAMSLSCSIVTGAFTGIAEERLIL